ncbi:MAG: formylmethanofuran dehydrogenase subunit C [Zhaonellaceae bacterium]|jgi:formylmethanofuran dehydrogenase subunit C
MSLTLELKLEPEVVLEAASLTPENLAYKSYREIAAVKLLYGKETVSLGDFFTIKGSITDGKVVVAGDLHKVNYLGFRMGQGTLEIVGEAGKHLGEEMSGGTVIIHGKAGDFLGARMSGGIIRLYGQAGDYVGSSPVPGQPAMKGGIIYICGIAGANVGVSMRRGLILVTGDCGDFLGGEMLGGTVISCGQVGSWPGGNMRRGTIILQNKPSLLPTFNYSCTYSPLFLALLRKYLAAWAVPVPSFLKETRFMRFLGDNNELGKGEILIPDA